MVLGNVEGRYKKTFQNPKYLSKKAQMRLKMTNFSLDIFFQKCGVRVFKFCLFGKNDAPISGGGGRLKSLLKPKLLLKKGSNMAYNDSKKVLLMIQYDPRRFLFITFSIMGQKWPSNMWGAGLKSLPIPEILLHKDSIMDFNYHKKVFLMIQDMSQRIFFQNLAIWGH